MPSVGPNVVRSVSWRTAAIATVAAFSLPLLPLIVVFLAANFFFPFPEEQLRKPASTVVLDREGSPLRISTASDDKYRIAASLSEISPDLQLAVIASEDRWFWRHPGVNPFAIVRAAGSNVRAGRVVSGASTITMQIARMAEPKRRTAPAKVIEMFRALQLESRYSKRELLEIYLNLAPYGGNLEGVGAASWFYFGKQPSDLSLGEIALLTTLPRSPVRFDPVRNHRTATAARDRVLSQLQQRGAFPDGEIANARRHLLPTRRLDPPFLAPHFSDYVAFRSKGARRITTTLDRAIQRTAEELVASRIAALRASGIENSAVVVIENRTRAVRAMVGSAGFFDRKHHGQVNGAVARRSPGSALKPFLFAMSFDAGETGPDSLLLDVPTDYGGYVAENYDDVYRGRITSREALIQSLNASSVRLLASSGLKRFLSLLRRGGLTTLDRKDADYGLPLILGGGEVTLLDLTNLYATFASGGVHAPVVAFGAERSNDGGERLFTAESAAILTSILTELKRPDFPDTWSLTRDAPAVAWKTGTSYGHRDAWSVGYSDRYTIGVWVGNFDGRGQKGLSGSEHAAPLLFDLFRTIEGGGANLRPAENLRLEWVDVCAESRELPTSFCPSRTKAQYIVGVTRVPSCSWHRQVIVDAERGERLLGDCAAGRPQRTEVVTVYPPELVAYWRAQQQPVPSIPRLSERCSAIPSDQSPRIVSPAETTPYRIRRGVPVADQRIHLAAQSAEDAGKLFWYQDGELVASGSPDARLFVTPVPGSHRLVVVDESGRSGEITYTVE